MKLKFTITSTGKRLTVVCEEESRKTVLVRSHFRMINGRKVFVKAHRRKR